MKKYSIFLWFIVGIISILYSCREDLRDIKLEVDDSPGLDLNFSFVNKPNPGMELIANLYYVEEENEPFYERNPDKVLKHTLNAKDIERGLTLTFEEPIPSALAYVIAYVDVDGNGDLSDGDIAVCYLAQSVREVMKGIATAENVSHREFLTMRMDRVYSSIRPPLEVNLTFPSPPLPGSNLELGLYYAESEDKSLLDRDPDILRQHTLTENDLTSGLTFTLEDVEDLPYLYALAYVDIDGDGDLSYGDIAMFYGGISVNDVEEGRALPENISVRNTIAMEMSEWYADENGPLTDVDGNTYRTVVIGDLEWMAEDLKVTRYRNGAPIATGFSGAQWITLTSGAYAVYPYDQTNGVVASEEDMIAKYGLLYNGYAVTAPEGLAPIGWRVATDEDYKNLERFVGMLETEIAREGSGAQDRGNADNIAHKLRSENWTANPPSTDEFGFNALPAGYRQGGNAGNFMAFNTWQGNNLAVSTLNPAGDRLYRRSIRLLGIFKDWQSKNLGMSVRCVRDIH